MTALSPRLREVVDALPLRPGLRVLEIGGAPGAAAREVTDRVGPTGHVLVLDRSAAGIALVERTCREQIDDGRLSVRRCAIEEFAPAPDDEPFDLAFACRVGALDGRHPALFERSLVAIRAALRPGGALFVDTGSPLTEIPLAVDRNGPPR